MKLSIQNIQETPSVVTFAEDVDELNALLQHRVRDYFVTSPIGVTVSHYRAGLDVFLDGDLWAHLEGTCSRCLSSYPFRLVRGFALVFAPRSTLGPDAKERAGELSQDDLALSFYSGQQIDLSPLVSEQLLLALPSRPLCGASCRGLCPQCGVSLNGGACRCVVDHVDPRLAVLRNLRIDG